LQVVCLLVNLTGRRCVNVSKRWVQPMPKMTHQGIDSIDLMFGWQVMYTLEYRLLSRKAVLPSKHIICWTHVRHDQTPRAMHGVLQCSTVQVNSIISAVVWRVSVAKTACRSCAHNKSHLCDCNCSAHVQAAQPQQRQAAQCATFTYQGCA
jgi:hypothetical protein